MNSESTKQPIHSDQKMQDDTGIDYDYSLRYL